MDVLKNKAYKNYDYTSRYSGVPYYYHSVDDKYIYGTGKQLSDDISYVAHKVKEADTVDSLALYYYNNPTYYWVICMFNNIQDPFIKLSEHFDIIKIPNISSIVFEDKR